MADFGISVFNWLKKLNVSFSQFLDDDKEEEDEESSHAPSVASNKMEEGDSEDVSLGNFWFDLIWFHLVNITDNLYTI